MNASTTEPTLEQRLDHLSAQVAVLVEHQRRQAEPNNCGKRLGCLRGIAGGRHIIALINRHVGDRSLPWPEVVEIENEVTGRDSGTIAVAVPVRGSDVKQKPRGVLVAIFHQHV